MAQVTLTDRQKEIKSLLDQGKTAEETGKKLKITTNAVYQQIRRMRKLGVRVGGTQSTGKATGNSRTQRRVSGGSKPKASAKKASTPRRQSARTSQAAPAQPQTAEELLRSEIADLKARAEEERSRVKEAEAVIVEANRAIEGIEAEAATREDVLAVLTGEKVAHAKPTPKAEAPKAKGGKGGKGATAKASTEAAPAAEEAPPQPEATTDAPAAAEAASAPAEAAPSNGGTAAETAQPATQAEREATADFDPFSAGEKGEGEAAEAEAAQAAAEEPQTA
jgi:ribonuclease E